MSSQSQPSADAKSARTTSEASAEWKPWRGGDCPVVQGQRFQVEYENGDRSAWDRGTVFNVQGYIWNTVEPNLRITAYRAQPKDK